MRDLTSFELGDEAGENTVITKKVSELNHSDMEKYVFVRDDSGRAANGGLSLIVIQPESVTLHVGHYSLRGLHPDTEIEVSVD